MLCPRTATSLAFAFLLSGTGCRSVDFGAEFAASQKNLPKGGLAIVEHHDGEPFRYLASVDPESVPAAARRTSDEFVQPGGRTVFIGREWSEAQQGFRFVKAFGSVAAPRFRSLLVDAEGNVLERSHEIEIGATPAIARDAALARVAGAISRVEVIQGKWRTPDVFRIVIRDPKGAEFFVITSMTGQILAHGADTTSPIYAPPKS